MNKFEAYGMGAGSIGTLENAIKKLFPLKAAVIPSTPLCCKSNPFCTEIKNAKNILDVGCGFGRNADWIIENTEANYYGLDPNVSLKASFKERTSKHNKSKRVFFCTSFDEIKENIYDVVVATYVFQHIAPKPQDPNVMNLNEITEEIFKYTKPGTIWFLIDHEQEAGGWQKQWFKDFNIEPEVYIKNCQDFEEIHPIGKHNLTIFKQNENILAS